ncbi:MAG: MarR family transcriptional regulator [Desulfobacterales bacterium]|nr:MarR family transcriptional regulator [Desulfobacterales bacterium]
MFSEYTLFAMNDERHKIHGKFESIMGLTLKLEKTPKRYGTDHNLSHSEIHLIEIIGDSPAQGVTDLSRLIGVTKGAISQSLKRLEKKGLTDKTPDPENLSRSLVTLTAKGQVAYWAHKHWHETMDGGFSRYLETINERDITVILDFLTRVEDFLVRRIESPE